MSEKMLMFTNIVKQSPPKREALTRRGDFNEIYKEYIHKKAAEQSADVLSVESLFVKFIVL